MDSIRAIACATVIFWHCLLTIVPSDPTAGQQLFSFPLGVAARESVITFVLLSGYLLGRHWRGGFDRLDIGRKFWTYMVRRTWRIVPAFWAAVTLVLLAMLLLGLDEPEGTHWDTGLPLTGERVLSNYLMLTDVLGQVPLSHQLWTVPIEYHLYLLAPLIVIVRRRSLALMLGTVVTLATVFALPDYHAPFFVFAFFAAFWLGIERQDHVGAAARDTFRVVLPIFVLSIALLVVVALTSPLPSSAGRYFLADALVTPVFLWWVFHADVAQSRSVLVRVLGWRPLRWLGQRSYSHYLVHAVILEIMWRFAVRPLDIPGDRWNIATMMLAGYAITLAAGVVFYEAIERPTALKAARIGRASTSRRDSSPASASSGVE